MDIGGTHYSAYELQYMVLGFLVLGLLLAGIAAYCVTTSLAHRSRIRLAASCVMWVLAAADVAEMVYIGYVQQYPVLTWSYLLAPSWVPITVYALALATFSLFGMWRSFERHPSSTHG